MANPYQSLFITGLYRSGTTLLEKLVHNLDDTFILSQPFPFLFYYFKQLFFREKGLNRALPLGTLFQESYRVEEFCDFLQRKALEAHTVRSILAKTTEKGIYTPETYNHLDEQLEGNFLDHYASLLTSLIRDKNGVIPSYVGSKEILCEEYMPYFLEQGYKVLLIVRDPRDVICSLNFGKGGVFTGDIRSTLFNLRNWRKSVAFALQYRDHPNCRVVYYERLANKPLPELQEISAFIGTNQAVDREFFNRPLLDQDGNVWKGNSSFMESMAGNVGGSSVQKYKEQLDVATIQWIEAFCYPELATLGYEIEQQQGNLDDLKTAIDAFQDLFYEYPDPELLESQKRVEKQRLESLATNPREVETEPWFIFPEAFKHLKNALQ